MFQVWGRGNVFVYIQWEGGQKGFVHVHKGITYNEWVPNNGSLISVPQIKNIYPIMYNTKHVCINLYCLVLIIYEQVSLWQLYDTDGHADCPF